MCCVPLRKDAMAFKHRAVPSSMDCLGNTHLQYHPCNPTYHRIYKQYHLWYSVFIGDYCIGCIYRINIWVDFTVCVWIGNEDVRCGVRYMGDAYICSLLSASCDVAPAYYPDLQLRCACFHVKGCWSRVLWFEVVNQVVHSHLPLKRSSSKLVSPKAEGLSGEQPCRIRL